MLPFQRFPLKLMIVESPNKVKKIAAILGDGWKIAASFGHIRDLPSDHAGVSAPDYRPEYELTDRGKKVIAQLKPLAANAEAVYLATDPDREGEAISWHLCDALRLRNPLRVTFDSITESVIRAAVRSPRSIDMDLVRAQEARRVVDRLVGFSVSPWLGHVLREKASAGRVQTPAVRLVVEREREIADFRVTNHYVARLAFSGGQWSATWVVKLFLKEGESFILDRQLAEIAAGARDLKVLKFEEKDVQVAPPAAFTTSTLLQAASVQLRYKPDTTAKLSQALFEQGLITYHRTDSQNLSAEAIEAIRAYATAEGLPLPPQSRRWPSKDDAQEAHEAIRPSHIEQERGGETDQERALYTLIRERALASQLANAVYAGRMMGLEARINGRAFHYAARSRVLKQLGWRSITAKDAADEDTDGNEDCGQVPFCTVGDTFRAESGQVLEKKTVAPPRFSQASLIKKLEELGIGRPSTYATTVSGIMVRGYVVETKNKITPTDKAYRAIDSLKGKFEFAEYEYTKELEKSFDEVAKGVSRYLEVVSLANQRLVKELECSGIHPNDYINKPTSAQISYAERLSKTLGKPIPSHILTDRALLGAWLTEAKASANKEYEGRLESEPASEAQIKVIQRAMDEGKLEKPDEWPSVTKLAASRIIDLILSKKKGAKTAKKSK